MNYTAKVRNTPTPQPELFDLSLDEEPGGARPDWLTEVRPQERVQRHTVEQIILAPMLDVPVPLMEEQLLVDAFAPHDIQVPEQVIEVPKDPLRRALGVKSCSRAAGGGTAGGSADDHLLFLVAAIVEQNVDIPVPRGGVRGLQGFPPGQASTTSSFSLERISERNVEQIVDIPGGGLQDFSSRTWFILFFACSSSWS